MTEQEMIEMLETIQDLRTSLQCMEKYYDGMMDRLQQRIVELEKRLAEKQDTPITDGPDSAI